MIRLYALLLLAATVSSARAAVSNPNLTYHVLHTPHFEVIFSEPQLELAKRYALAAEQAYELLIPIFKEAPDVTPIFINDNTDSSNGMATFLPYPTITVYPVLPGTLDSIDDYGDWPLEMIVHEYTHILNMYPAHGFWTPIKYLFGGVVRPNAILPKWYLEGLAVDLESHLTDHGRLRAPQTWADSRALTLGLRLQAEDIARINEQEISSWPYGNRPYAFGGWWWNDIQREKGTEIIYTWNQSFARRIPFLLNQPMREQTGKKAVELLSDTAERLRMEASRELELLKTVTPHVGMPVAEENGEQRMFALSPSGSRLIYLLSRPHKPGSVLSGTEARIKTRTRLAEPFKDIPSRFVFKAVGASKVRWLNEEQVVFDQIDIHDPYNRYRDLYLYDLAKDETTRLTLHLRAGDASPSPTGDKIAFIKSEAGRNDLGILELRDGKVKKISFPVHSSFTQRLSGPEFINANQIVFAMRTRAGDEKLWLYSLAGNKVAPWSNSDLKSAQNARATAKGVLISDDRTGVRNIYAVPLGPGAVRAVTNTLTHIEVADYDPQTNELLFAELGPDGVRLLSTPFAEYKPAWITVPKLPAPPTPETKKISVTETTYEPAHYLWPRYWIPFVYQVEGGLLFQGSTGTSDPAGRNSYSLDASYDTVTKTPAYGLSYLNSSLPLNLGFDYDKIVSYLGGATSRTVESHGGDISFSDPAWPFGSSFTQWSGKLMYDDTTGRFASYRRMGPALAITYNRMSQPVNTWGGFLLEATHREYLAQSGYTHYGRSSARGAVSVPAFGSSKIFMQARGIFAPQMPTNTIVDLGDRSLGANYMVNLTNSDLLMRGYPSGQFVGRKVLNGNFEFSLPAWELAKGAGTFPVFLRSLETVLFTDVMAVDGAAYRSDKEAYYASSLNRYFVGSGAELRLSATGAYHLPFTVTLGGYYGFSRNYGGGFSPFFGIGYSEDWGLSSGAHKTP